MSETQPARRPTLGDIEQIVAALENQGYIAGREIATAVFLSIELHKPLLVEGAAGVGKTEIAKVMARALGTDLIRLQCYEGLDVNTALYEWNYQKQMLRIRLEEQGDRTLEEKEHAIFSEPFLLRRPLLQAITHHRPPVLLIDEVDRVDEEFEAFLLEVLSDWQITIPEIGTIRAQHVPYVVLTSNRTRELSDALRRRCLYLWIDYPDFQKELRIVRTKVPGISRRLAEQITAFMRLVRRLDLSKVPGVAETLDWSAALMRLHRENLDRASVEETIGCICKHQEDQARVRGPWLDSALAAIAEAQRDGEPMERALERVEKTVRGGDASPRFR
ncbi:MAG: MoxR family ATPase [Armatimonadota bacterium]|nr:MoxR family ATPase [Armatimonadota bacterium]MDR5696189.1 MoxR family ATPase [Armatimonadota bacterium]